VNTDIDMSWPEVSAGTLRTVLATMDYRRDAWSNAILYLEKHSGRRIAFEVGNQPHERHYLHPALAAEDATLDGWRVDRVTEE
jgi:hypothetical protein